MSFNGYIVSRCQQRGGFYTKKKVDCIELMLPLSDTNGGSSMMPLALLLFPLYVLQCKKLAVWDNRLGLITTAHRHEHGGHWTWLRG